MTNAAPPVRIEGPREDVTWAFLTVLREHRYDDRQRTATKPEDPGWHACSCGWEGYWCDWQPHVADVLVALEACAAHGRYGCVRVHPTGPRSATSPPVTAAPRPGPLRDLAAQLTDLLPGATGFRFLVDADIDPGGALLAVSVDLPDAQWEDLADGTARPGPDLAAHLTRLGWTLEATDGDPVADDVPTVTLTAPAPGSPLLLAQVWRRCQDAFDATPVDDRLADVTLP